MLYIYTHTCTQTHTHTHTHTERERERERERESERERGSEEVVHEYLERVWTGGEWEEKGQREKKERERVVQYSVI